jgi:arginase
VDALGASGAAVSIEVIERGAPFRDTGTSAAVVNARLAGAVRRAVGADELPVVVSGSCNSALGVLAGFEHARCGVVWLDAHADFNTPDSTASGFFPGMSLAVVTGHCFGNYWAQIGDSTPVAEDAIVMFGVRDLSPDAERERLYRSAIHVAEADGDVAAALDRLAARMHEVYLHVDFDGFAPDVAPGVADEPVPGGLSLEDGEAIIRATAERFRIKAATLATYTPDLDRDDKTLRLGLRLIELLEECTVATR